MATKKDFQATADILSVRLNEARGMFNREGRDLAVSAIIRIVNDFAEHYAAENPRFSKEKFLAACGL